MHALYHPALNGRKASDWSRPILCQWEGGKLPKGTYQSSNGYSHVSSQGKEAVFVTHDIYIYISNDPPSNDERTLLWFPHL